MALGLVDRLKEGTAVALVLGVALGINDGSLDGLDEGLDVSVRSTLSSLNK